MRQTPDSSSVEPNSQNTSELGEEQAGHESQSADRHDKGSEDGLPDSHLQDSFIGTTQDEELHSHRWRSSKGSEPFEKWERDEMEKLLLQLNGRLGMYRCSDPLDNEIYSAHHSCLSKSLSGG